MKPNRDQANAACAWSLWLLAQAGVLALFAYRMPISSKFPAPMEANASVAVALTQMILATALAPLLLRDLRAVLCAIAAVMPITLLATVLAGSPWTHAITPVLVSGAWFGVLALVNRCTPVLQTPLQALLLLLSVGAPAMVYLASEFTVREPAAMTWLPWASPALGAASTCLHPTSNFGLIALPLGVLLLGLVLNHLRQGPRTTSTGTESDPGSKGSA